MERLYFLLILLLLVSCGNNPNTKSSEVGLSVEEVTVVKEKLDSCLVKGVLELIHSEEHLKYPEIPLNESFIVIGFLKGSDSRTESDSIVNISYFHNTFNPYDNENNYKGIINIDGYNIAIFDRRNFGDKFYNTDSLKQIPLDGFKGYPMKDILLETFFVYDGKLNYRGAWVIPYKESDL